VSSDKRLSFGAVLTTPLERAVPVESPFAAIHDELSPEAFGTAAIARLQAARSANDATRERVGARLIWKDPRSRAQFPWQPHATGAVNAWALLMLPGPGKDADPWEMSYDWSPSWGAPARHLAEFPHYTANTMKGVAHSWVAMRRVFTVMHIPGVRRPLDRVACWGVANLTAQHSRDEASRVLDKHDVRLRRAVWVLGTCRPVVVASPPGKDSRDIDVVAAALSKLGLAPTGTFRRWAWTQSGNQTYRIRADIWRGDQWSTGLIRLNQHPSRWGSERSIGYPVALGNAMRWVHLRLRGLAT
jgi:hypothetical protein